MTERNAPDAVFFDLDGTLADTAADLSAALNAVLSERDRAPLPLAQTRPYVSMGAVALICLGFNLKPDDPALPPLRSRFLDYYSNNLCNESRLFPGIAGFLHDLLAREIPFGVVTNKPRAYTSPLLEALELPLAPASVVCGDDLPVKKPHPAPLRHACRSIGAPPFNCIYIGDDRRDVIAGRRAGMRTFAANWGYIGPGEDPAAWGAHLTVGTPDELSGLIL